MTARTFKALDGGLWQMLITLAPVLFLFLAFGAMQFGHSLADGWNLTHSFQVSFHP